MVLLTEVTFTSRHRLDTQKILTSGREDCFQGNNCAAVVASATGGGADLCGFLSPAARITGFRGAPCNPTLLEPGFHGCREEWGSSKGCSVPVESLLLR